MSRDGHWDCLNKTTGLVGRCGAWNRIAFSNAQIEPSDRAGFLRNNSQGYGTNAVDHSCSNITRSMLILDRMIFGLMQSGMLGHIQQSPYTSSFIEESGVEPPFIYVPFFDEYPSPAAIDQRYAQLQE